MQMVRAVRLLVGSPTLNVNRLIPRAFRHHLRTASRMGITNRSACSLFASLAGHQVKERASTESEGYKIPLHTCIHSNHTMVEYIDMTTESGSADFNDFFYEVRVPFIYPCFYSQSLVPVWFALCPFRGHLPPKHPSFSSVLHSTQHRISIRTRGQLVKHTIKPGDRTRSLPLFSLQPCPAELFTSNRRPGQRWNKTLCHLFCADTTVSAQTRISDDTILPF